MTDEHALQDQIVEELTLLLLYLTSWRERFHGELGAPRAWKGFRFEALDALEKGGYLTQTRRAKSVHLTDEGVERAQVLAAKYLGDAAALF
jgi:hypothetical protein